MSDKSDFHYLIVFHYSIIVVLCMAYMLSVFGHKVTKNEFKKTEQAYIETIQQKNDKIAESTELLLWSRKVNKLSMVLEQVLTPLQIYELQALNERLKQEKHRKGE